MADVIYANDALYLTAIQLDDPSGLRMSRRSKRALEFSRAAIAAVGGVCEELFVKLLGRARAHFTALKEANKTSLHPLRVRIPMIDDGSRVAYEAASSILNMREKDLKCTADIRRSEMSLCDVSMYLTKMRLGKWLTKSIIAGSDGGAVNDVVTRDDITDSTAIRAISIHMANEHALTARALNKNRAEYYIDPDEMKWNLFDVQKSLDKEITVVAFGPIMAVKIHKRVYLTLAVTPLRIIDLLERFANIMLFSSRIGITRDPVSFIKGLLENLAGIWQENPEYLGACFKSARQALILGLDSSQSMGTDQRGDYLATLDKVRRDGTQLVLSVCRPHIRSPIALVNFLGMYKGVITVDVNVSDLMGEISGLTNANKVDDALMIRFEGAMRRAAYFSLSTMGVRVRGTTLINASEGLAERLDAPGVSPASLATYPAMVWAGITFEEVDGDLRASESEIPVSNKASAKPGPLTDESREILDQWSRDPLSPCPRELDSLGNMNDVESMLRGESNLDLGKAIERFKNVIKKHEAFEAKYPGVDPSDIPSEDLAAFLSRDPMASYAVSTEPKVGEFHKAVTRTFYMGEQALKALTQAVERLARRISRKQTGVSIVKGYAGRRHDLEEMCNTMTGNESERRNIFVSFDMSEFSKKFPGKLLRSYGKMLSEITGEKWLRRIDLIFRASIVYMENRGFGDSISGVMGGFEGFMNFVWSSIHATVMEVALEATGRPGSILVYSDDGLLRFMVRSTTPQSEVRILLETIQRVYGKLGLVFNMKKTMVSAELWEYLGEFCYKSKLLPSWMKELSAFNRVATNRGIHTAYGRVSEVIAKGRACCSYGMDPILTHFLVTMYSAQIVKKIKPNVSPDALVALLILPPSAGGFRVPALTELASTNKVSSLMEADADLGLLESLNAPLARTIASELIRTMDHKADRISAIVRNSLLKTTLPDTSGNAVLHQAISVARTLSARGVALTANPIDTATLMELDAVAKNTVNLRPDEWSQVISSTPQWKDYMSGIGIISGSGALKLLPRKELRQFQAMDTKLCMRAINHWMESTQARIYSNTPATGCLRRIALAFLSGYSIGHMYQSTRLMLIPATEHIDIELKESFPGGVWHEMCDYVEPAVSFPDRGSSLSWASEARKGKGDQATKLFLEVAARYIVANPDGANTMMRIGAVFGIEVPPVPLVIMTSLRRRAGQRGTSLDVSVSVPQTYKAHTEVLPVGVYASSLYGAQRADRTTLREIARLAGFVQSAFSRSSQRNPTDGNVVRGFKVHSGEVNDFHYPQETRDGPDIGDIKLPPGMKDDVKKAFLNTLLEYQNLQAMQEQINNMSMYHSHVSDLDRLMITALQEKSLTQWMMDIRHTRPIGLNHCPPGLIPRGLRPIAIQRSIVTVALETSSALTKTLVRRAAMKAFHRTASLEAATAALLQSLYGQGMENAVDEFCGITRGLVATLEELRVPGVEVGDILDLTTVTRQLGQIIMDLTVHDDAFSAAKAPIIIIRPPASAGKSMTSAHRAAFRRAFTLAIDAVLSRESIGPVTFKRIALTTRMFSERMVDYLYLLRDHCRASEHRDYLHPYNKMTAYISFVKCSILLNQLYHRWSRGDNYLPDESDLEGWRLPADARANIESHLSGSVRDSEPGINHRRMLEDGVIPGFLVRVRQHYRMAHASYGAPAIAVYMRRVNYTHVMDDLLSIYRTVVVPAAQAIIEYPREILDSVVRHTPMTPELESNILMLTSPSTTIAGDMLPFGGLRDYEGLEEIYAILLERGMVGTGRSGYRGVGSSAARTKINDIIASKYMGSADGLSVAFYGESKEQANGESLFCIRHTSLEEATACLMSVWRVPGTCSVLVRLTPPDIPGALYGVVGTSRSDLDYSRNARPPRANAPLVGRIEDYVYAPTIKERVKALSLAVGQMLGVANSTSMSLERAMAGTVYARMHYGEAVVNSYSPTLQAAYDAAQEGYSPRLMIQAYVLMIGYLSWGSDQESLWDIFETFKRVYLDNNVFGRKGIMVDVVKTYQWLKMHPMSLSDSLDANEVMSIRQSVSSMNTKIQFSTTFSMERPRDVHMVASDAGHLTVRDLVGMVGEYLTDRGVNLRPDDMGLLIPDEDLFTYDELPSPTNSMGAIGEFRLVSDSDDDTPSSEEKRPAHSPERKRWGDYDSD